MNKLFMVNQFQLFEELKMKKLYVGIVFGIFALASFVALNMYTSTSFPGFGGNEACNNCHNQPALVKQVDMSFGMSDFATANSLFSQYGQFAADEVPIIPTNNRSDANLEFSFVTFLKNTTHVMIRAQVPDSTVTAKSSGSSTSDKFGFIFNIDVVNFTVGDFITYYNSTETNLDDVLSGQMMFTNGHADFWYVDVNTLGYNATGMAVDKSISSGILTDAAQDVHVGIWYGDLGHGSVGYRYYFVRALNTGDSNDAQFNVDGTAIHYAIAAWNDESAVYHLSSFDQMVIVGNEFNVIHAVTDTVTNTATTTETETETATETATTTVSGSASASGTTSSFTAVFVLAGLFVSIPIIAKMRNRKE
jgi:hypothetical protein